MPAKAPIYLKASGGKNGHGKGPKKLREILSTDMISPPLGDFRHMAHVGRGGTDDMFGDTSFLQKGNSTLPSGRKSDGNLSNGSGFKRGGSVGKKEKGSKKGKGLTHEQSSTLDRFRRKKRNVIKSDTSNGENNDTDTSPTLQSALSLPILSNDTESSKDEASRQNSEGSPGSSNNNIVEKRSKSHEEVFVPQSPTSDPESPLKTPNGTTSGPPKPRRIMSNKGENPYKKPAELEIVEPTNLTNCGKLSPLRRSSEVLSEMPASLRKNNTSDQAEDDGWNLDLDFGPSLLDEIMGMMDSTKIAS